MCKGCWDTIDLINTTLKIYKPQIVFKWFTLQLCASNIPLIYNKICGCVITKCGHAHEVRVLLQNTVKGYYNSLTVPPRPPFSRIVKRITNISSFKKKSQTYHSMSVNTFSFRFSGHLHPVSSENKRFPFCAHVLCKETGAKWVLWREMQPLGDKEDSHSADHAVCDWLRQEMRLCTWAVFSTWNIQTEYQNDSLHPTYCLYQELNPWKILCTFNW